MPEADFKGPEKNDTPKSKVDEGGISAPKWEVNPISVLSKNFDSQTLEAVYKYRGENPQAKEALDAVIKAFSLSPHTIEEFVTNCITCPLPTDGVSLNGFCDYYATEIRENQATQQMREIQKEKSQAESLSLKKEEAANLQEEQAEKDEGIATENRTVILEDKKAITEN